VLRIFHLGYAYLFTLTVYLAWMFMKEFGPKLIRPVPRVISARGMAMAAYRFADNSIYP
jgi:hypothetical protein